MKLIVAMIHHCENINLCPAPNGKRYPRVGGTRQRRFAGTSFEPRKLLENAATPTRRVHAVLASLNDLNNSICKFLYRILGSTQSQFICQGRTITHYFVL